MKRSSEYSSGHFVQQSQMVNGHYLGQQTPGFIPIQVPYGSYYAVQLPPPVVLPSYQTQYPQQYVQPQLIRGPVPPPLTSTTIPSQVIEVRKPAETLEKRPSKAIPIIHPDSKKEVTKELQQNELSSSLREDAPDFVPSSCGSIICDQNLLSTETDSTLPDIELQDTVVNLDDTLESDELEAELSFENSEAPSITASIRQIPSNLEHKLSQEDEIHIIKEPILPIKQESHSSLPDAFRDDSSRKQPTHTTYSQSPPFHNDFHQFHPRNFGQNFGPRMPIRNNTTGGHRGMQDRHNRHPPPFNHRHQQQHHKHNNQNFTHYNERNFHPRFHHEPNFNSWKPPFKHHQNHTNGNSQNRKVDQACTAHSTTDINQNEIISETEKLKELMLDENNNEQTQESVNMVEESLLESTGENSLNTSCRYSNMKLTALKKSPLVLTKAPTQKDGLLDSKLNSCVWKLLFDRSYRIDEDSNDTTHNTSLQTSKSFHLKKTNSNLRYENNHGQLSRSKSNDKQLIKINTSMKEDVKLNEAENAWKPSHVKHPEDMSDEKRELEELLKNFRSLLNKITEENFEHLVKEISDKQKFVIDSSEKLSAIVKLLFEKSISEPGYASTYAKLCHALSTVHVFDVETARTTKKISNPWKIYLISHCQLEFERTKKDDILFKEIQDRINNASDTEEIESLEDCYFKIRQRANGTVKFIGELYKMNMLTVKIMKSCIEVLLKSVTEENIERLCKLFTTVGEKLEAALKGGNDMNRYMQDLEKLKNSKAITTLRIKFDIMNVIDLRATNWKPRENSRGTETKPQKLQDLQEEEEKRKRRQQQQLNEYNERQPKSQNNSFGRQRSQRSIDNEGFRLSTAKQFDFNKCVIPKKNTEVTLGPPKNLFQNFSKPLSKMAPPPTTVSNSFGNLPTDCDDVDDVPLLHHTRSGGNGNNKNNRKDKIKKSNSHSQGKSKKNSKGRTPSPEIEKVAEIEDDFFMIDLTADEEKDMRSLVEKMQQVFKGKITLEMLIADLKKVSITNNVLGCVYTDLFDKKSAERKELIALVGEISQKGLITETVNVEALKLAIKSIPTIICDVPHAWDYFSEYCGYFIETGLLTMENIENICQNQQNVFDKINEKAKALNVEDKSLKKSISGYYASQQSEILEYEASNEFEESEQSISNKSKLERCLKTTMKSIQFKLEKNKKNNYLEEIYSIIDKENCQEASNFIKDLTITILKTCYENKGKKAKKTVDLSQLFPLFIRYIGDDVSSQIDCINALHDFAVSSEKDHCNLSTLFDLFYENDVISMEAFKFWKDRHPISQPKREALDKTTSFFTKLEEADLSVDDFNCTSSTIKD